jgi:hypothetical protein
VGDATPANGCTSERLPFLRPKPKAEGQDARAGLGDYPVAIALSAPDRPLQRLPVAERAAADAPVIDEQALAGTSC